MEKMSKTTLTLTLIPQPITTISLNHVPQCDIYMFPEHLHLPARWSRREFIADNSGMDKSERSVMWGKLCSGCQGCFRAFCFFESVQINDCDEQQLHVVSSQVGFLLWFPQPWADTSHPSPTALPTGLGKCAQPNWPAWPYGTDPPKANHSKCCPMSHSARASNAMHWCDMHCCHAVWPLGMME